METGDMNPEKSPPGLSIYPLIATSIGHFTNDGTLFLVPVVIDLAASLYGTGTLIVTASLVLFYLSTAISANLLGPTIDRKHFQAGGMVLGIVILSSGLIMYSLSVRGTMVPTFLVLSSIVAGVGASFYHPTGSSILQSYYGGGRLGRYLGINGSAGSLGRAIYPSLLFLVGAFLVSNSSSIIFFGMFGLLLSVLMFIGIRDYAKEDRAKTSHAGQASVHAGSKGSGKPARTSLRGGVSLLAVISLFRTMAFFGIVAWIPEYLTFSRGIGTSLLLGYTMTLMFSGGIAGQLVVGRLVESHDKRSVLVATTLMSAALMFLYLLTSGWLSLLMLGLFGFFNFSGFPIFMSMVSDYVPRGSTTSSNALVWNLGGTGGQTIGPLVVAFLIGGNYAGLSFAFEILLVLGALSVLLALILPRPVRESRASLFG